MNTGEGALVDLDIAQRAKALQAWVDDCKTRMKSRWPEIDFDSDDWPIKTRYKTDLLDVNFAPSLDDFHRKDPAYVLTLKCLMAEIALKGDIKDPFGQIPAWRLLSRIDVPLHQLRRVHLTEMENALTEQALASPNSAGSSYRNLLVLRAHIDLTGNRGVTDRLAWSPAPKTRAQLLALEKISKKLFKDKKSSILDRQIEALSDAQTAMFRGDDRLSAYDRVALAVMGINMCCPNRVNEPLCMAVDDSFTLEDYLMCKADDGLGVESQIMERLHQMLLVKGSKGSDFKVTARPAAVALGALTMAGRNNQDVMAR